MKIVNNKDLILINEVRNYIAPSSKVYISSDFVTAYSLFMLLDDLKKAASLQILVDKVSDDDFNFLFSDNEKALNFELDRKYKVNQIIGLINKKAHIRKGASANQRLLIIQNNEESQVFMLTNLNLDCLALGTSPSTANIAIPSYPDNANQFLGLFETAWDNSRETLNDVIINLLEKGTQNISGEALYKYTMREIFHYSTTDERADERLQKIGFKDSVVWSLLYNFQKDAVIGAIEKIEKYKGCIIADSVGLGKTFEALAVIKYYELLNKNVLVLAPKKLRENWTMYKGNNINNLLAKDRFSYEVLNHTDLTRERGFTGDTNLETINWGNYDLVVIDESHNFRNNPTRRNTLTRYRRLMNDIIKSSIRTKVLMLSATPVNNKMNDLKNQISFITEGRDDYFLSEGIDSVTQVMKDAQRKFTMWYRNNDPENLNVNDLMSALDGSYFRILDMLTIARSRKHIEKYYDTADIGKFPYRRPPETVRAEIDTFGKFKDIGQIYDEISTLTLAAYSPLGYVRAERRESYEEKYDMETQTGSVFKQIDREQSLIYLMRVNLLKRLESSIHAFQITVSKLIDFIDKNLKQLEEHRNSTLEENIEITEIDIDDTELEDLLVGGKTKVLIQDMDLIRWKQDLKLDKDVLTKLMGSIRLIDVERDAKLLELKTRIIGKLEKPINKGNKKAIVFTAFADTANYLYKELSDWLQNEYGVYSALITGSGTNKTNLPSSKSDLNSILTNFSPLSKKRAQLRPEATEEIDILFCTDCISEGQNLQDCDYLINYDIHWNPVRIIQRFGRIDRIGSVNNEIQLVNFFPNMELDSFIDLVGRVQGRMVMLDVSATGEDNIISQSGREMQDLEYRKKQLQQLQNQVLDLEDVQGTISITDLTFNDFKIDLEKSTTDELEELKDIPPASYAVVPTNTDLIKSGAIFCLKDLGENASSKLKNNVLYPFYLVYVSSDEQTILTATQTKLALDYFRKLCMGNDGIFPDLVAAFDKETQGNKKMTAYVKLLKTAMLQLSEVQEVVGIDSLATAGGTSLFAAAEEMDSNFELVSYLIIK